MIKIVGDISYSDGYFDIGFGIGSKLEQNYNPFQFLNFNTEDIWFGNLECVISDTSELTGLKAKCFRIPYKNVSALHHFDVYSVANNHIMEHGPQAFNETLENINKLGSKYVGSLSNRIIVINHKKNNFGFAVFSQRRESSSKKPFYWLRPENNEIELILNNLQNCNFRIIYIHWGNEFMEYPSVEQRIYAHWLIDKSFDVVIGTHPHLLQGHEIYKEKHIFYSLGNFLFNMPSEGTRYSAIVNLDIESGKLKVSHEYVFIDKENKPNIVAEENVPKKYRFETLNKKLSFDGDNEDYYEDMFKKLSDFRHNNHIWMLKTFFRHNFREMLFILNDYFIRRLFKH
jgi:poly-gamma-glutamate capsule biosynthesis protein CapA/YwtB (metallophosphatase superfamily)